MKSTLSDNRQLFNVKAIAPADLALEAIPEGHFAIVDEATNRTALPVDFYDLPENFRFVSKLDGKIYYSFDCMNKDGLFKQQAKEYQAEQVNIWKTTLEHCDCTKGVQLNINIDEDSLIRRDGLTWTHKDFVVAVSPKELECFCDCSGKGTYDNNVMTKLLFEKIQAINSPFYEAEVQDESGNALVDSAAIQAFIDANKAVNTDDDETNDGEKLVLFLKGKPQPAGNYADLDVNYIYPRGVRLNPSIIINGNVTVKFEQVQPLVFELGAGYDMRAEEFECMSLYTNLNSYPQLSDGVASSNLVYQFENAKNYNTVTFEFASEKSGLEDVYEGKNKRFYVLLGSEDSKVFGMLSTIFVP